jgi:hypothetical protein
MIFLQPTRGATALLSFHFGHCVRRAGQLRPRKPSRTVEVVLKSRDDQTGMGYGRTLICKRGLILRHRLRDIQQCADLAALVRTLDCMVLSRHQPRALEAGKPQFYNFCRPSTARRPGRFPTVRPLSSSKKQYIDQGESNSSLKEYLLYL